MGGHASARLERPAGVGRDAALWITRSYFAWIKPRFPSGFRVCIWVDPVTGRRWPKERPDVSVRSWPVTENPGPPGAGDGDQGSTEPDEEVAVATLSPETSVYVERQVGSSRPSSCSPRNKDRPIARDAYLARYLGYLLDGAHLVLIDVHRRPLGFSFPERIVAELQLNQPAFAPPLAVSYRVGEPAPGGSRLLAIWRRPLTVGSTLPRIPLPITPEDSLTLDLDLTYSRAAEDAYLT